MPFLMHVRSLHATIGMISCLNWQLCTLQLLAPLPQLHGAVTLNNLPCATQLPYQPRLACPAPTCHPTTSCDLSPLALLQDIDGRATKLDKFKGKTVLVVNLASACGFTPQYTELQELYQKYQSKGLVVLGFPVRLTHSLRQRTAYWKWLIANRQQCNAC